MRTLPKVVALGRIGDFILSRPDADRIALRPMQGTFADYEVRRFASRDAMREFLLKEQHREGRDMSGSFRATWNAAVKDRVQYPSLPSMEKGLT